MECVPYILYPIIYTIVVFLRIAGCITEIKKFICVCILSVSFFVSMPDVSFCEHTAVIGWCFSQLLLHV